MWPQWPHLGVKRMGAPVDTTHHRPAPEHPELLSEFAADVTFEGTNAGVISWNSPTVETLLGWPPEALIGRPFASLVPNESLNAVRDLQQDVRRGHARRLRLQLRHHDGGLCWFDMTVRPRRDRVGRVVGRYGSWHDVQAEVEAAQSLQRAIEQRDALFAAMLDPLVLLDAVRDGTGTIIDFRFADANPAACAYNRLPHAELVGRRLSALLPAHVGNPLFDQYVQVVTTGIPLVLDDVSYPREVFGGEERFYDIRAVKLGDGLTYTWRDVTDRHVAAAQLRESRALLAAALESELDPHLFLTAERAPDGRITDFRVAAANAKANDYLERGDAPLIGERLSELVSPAEWPRLMELYPTVVETGQPILREAMAATSAITGQEERFDILAVKVLDGLSLTWRNVTERYAATQRLAESEEQYRLIAENSSDVIVLIRDGKVAWISPSVEGITGQPAEAWIGREAADGIIPDDLPAYRDALEAISKGAVSVTRTRLLGADGNVHWAETSAKTYYDTDGVPDGIIATMRVVDGLVHAEQELAHAARHDAMYRAKRAGRNRVTVIE